MSTQHHTTPVEFRPVPGLHGYRADSDGNIWTCRPLRYGCDTLGTNWRKLKTCTGVRGYAVVCVRRDFKTGIAYAHQLVASAFLGERPAGFDLCHNNGDKLDNRPSNLRYDTRRNNQLDRNRHGTGNLGSRNGCSKLTESMVVAIRQRLLSGERVCALAREYGVKSATISDIKRRRTWPHL